MRRYLQYWVLVAVCLLYGAVSFANPIDDPTSLANINEVRISHLDLTLAVNFQTRQLTGEAVLTLDNITGADTLILDTRGLTIQSVSLGTGMKPTEYHLGKSVRYIGRPLRIQIAPTTTQVNIRYNTSEDAAALQWVNSEQTASGEKYFLYSQSQFNMARTWIPCQDSPAVRMTYEATIQVPEGYLALMSANNQQVINQDGLYHFSMPQPVPSYLMALAVGDLEYSAISDRSGVYAESSVAGAAAWEFAGTEGMIQAAESLYGPYQWEQYDLLILPPSFPFGGMENPRLTFTTPTVITGDRALVALIAHELAHSWSGNLVTNATWNDFWLNEGFTTYFERRITEATRGREYAEMLSELSYHSLRNLVKTMGPKNQDTALKLDLEGRNPEEAYSGIPYVKGMFFLRMLESHFGRERFDAFLSRYFDTFQFQSLTTEEFLEYLRENLLDNDAALERRLRIHEWIYEPGIPSNCPQPQSDELAGVDLQARNFLSGAAPSQLSAAGWSVHHWRHFFDQLPETLSEKQLAALDRQFGLTKSTNPVIQREWFALTARSGYTTTRQATRKFLTTVGRISLIRPVYKALVTTPDGLTFAKNIYREAKPGYHQMTRNAIEKILLSPVN